jgi:hypothetical protein
MGRIKQINRIALQEICLNRPNPFNLRSIPNQDSDRGIVQKIRQELESVFTHRTLIERIGPIHTDKRRKVEPRIRQNLLKQRHSRSIPVKLRTASACVKGFIDWSFFAILAQQEVRWNYLATGDTSHRPLHRRYSFYSAGADCKGIERLLAAEVRAFLCQHKIVVCQFRKRISLSRISRGYMH